jgi:glycosyltransferase involved in cell wall biosynthesis
MPDTDVVLSIVVPVYNEASTAATVIERLLAVPFSMAREVIVIDDGSTDGTTGALAAFAGRADVTIVRASPNAGKGAAIRRGIGLARGSVMAIQDADLELDPAQLPALVNAVVSGQAEVVYGSRFLRGRPDMSLISRVANRALTGSLNIVCDGQLTDMETCYKVIPVRVLRALGLESDRFDIEVEITAKLLRRGCHISELPINVHARSRAHGKKLRWRDGVAALRAVVRYGLKRRSGAAGV